VGDEQDPLSENARLFTRLRAFELRDLGEALVLQRCTHQLQQLVPVNLPGSIPDVLAEEVGERASWLAAHVGIRGVLVRPAGSPERACLATEAPSGYFRRFQCF
jgi:hypothetical protein